MNPHDSDHDELTARLHALPAERVPPARVWQAIAAQLPAQDRCAGTAMDLERALETLPPRARAVLVLHDIEGWKHQEIADQLQMAVGSSKAQLHRARGLLRARLGETA